MIEFNVPKERPIREMKDFGKLKLNQNNKIIQNFEIRLDKLSWDIDAKFYINSQK